jgi:Mg2+ and Co2+ transporter CorA
MIYERLLLIQKNVDSLLQTVVSATNLLETQQSSLDTKYALRLTILAIFFVPLQMTTGLFSMAERYLPGQSDSWIVASVCVPLLVLVVVLAFGGVMINKLRFWWRLGKTYVQAPSAPDPYAENGVLEA